MQRSCEQLRAVLPLYRGDHSHGAYVHRDTVSCGYGSIPEQRHMAAPIDPNSFRYCDALGQSHAAFPPYRSSKCHAHGDLTSTTTGLVSPLAGPCPYWEPPRLSNLLGLRCQGHHSPARAYQTVQLNSSCYLRFSDLRIRICIASATMAMQRSPVQHHEATFYFHTLLA